MRMPIVFSTPEESSTFRNALLYVALVQGNISAVDTFLWDLLQQLPYHHYYLLGKQYTNGMLN